jgi:hypothetical protein
MVVMGVNRISMVEGIALAAWLLLNRLVRDIGDAKGIDAVTDMFDDVLMQLEHHRALVIADGTPPASLDHARRELESTLSMTRERLRKRPGEPELAR